MVKSNRNYGIEVLRILLMLFIIEGHFLTHTNIRETLPFLSTSWIVVWLIQAITVSAVDGFVFITGYYQKAKIVNVKRLFNLWGKVLFYSIFIFLIFVPLGGQINPSYILTTFMPITFKQYWFFTVYILLFLLAPFINLGIEKLNQQGHKLLIIILIIFTIVKPTLFPFATQYDQTEGMGIVSFLTIYIWGSYCRRYVKAIKCKGFMLLLSVIIVFASKILLEEIVARTGQSAGSGLLYHYNTVFQIINCTLLFYIFKDFRISEKYKNFIAFFSTSVFGVYLIHEHPAIRDLLWKKLFAIETITEWSDIYFIVSLFVVPIVVLVICTLLDHIRLWIGRMVAHIKTMDNLLALIDSIQERITQSFGEVENSGKI